MIQIGPLVDSLSGLLTGVSLTAIAVIAWRVSLALTAVIELVEKIGGDPHEQLTRREIRAYHDPRKPAPEIIEDVRVAKRNALKAFEKYDRLPMSSNKKEQALAEAVLAHDRLLREVVEYLELNAL
jgi:hypothetical protein